MTLSWSNPGLIAIFHSPIDSGSKSEQSVKDLLNFFSEAKDSSPDAMIRIDKGPGGVSETASARFNAWTAQLSSGTHSAQEALEFVFDHELLQSVINAVAKKDNNTTTNLGVIQNCRSDGGRKSKLPPIWVQFRLRVSIKSLSRYDLDSTPAKSSRVFFSAWEVLTEPNETMDAADPVRPSTAPDALSTNQLISILNTFDNLLESIFGELLQAAGLKVQPSTDERNHWTSSINFYVKLNSLDSNTSRFLLVDTADEFAYLIHGVLKGGDTSGALVNGQRWVFHQQRLEAAGSGRDGQPPASETNYWRSMSLWIMRSDLTGSCQDILLLLEAISYSELSVIYAAGEAELKLGDSTTDSRSSEVRYDTYTNTVKYIDKVLYTQYCELVSAQVSFTPLGELPNFKSRVLEDNPSIRRLRERVRVEQTRAEHDWSAEFNESQRRSSERLGYLTYLVLAGAYLTGIMPFLLESSLRVSALQWSMLFVSLLVWSGVIIFVWYSIGSSHELPPTRPGKAA